MRESYRLQPNAVDWNVRTIVDCIGEPGKQTYRVTASGKTADTLVEWHNPNEVFTSVGPPRQPVVYNINGAFRVDQIFTLELCWNQEPIGPCAMVWPDSWGHISFPCVVDCLTGWV